MGDLRLRIDFENYSNSSQTCDVRQPHNRRLCVGLQVSRDDDYSGLNLRKLFRGPGLKKFFESQNHVEKYQFVKALISFLLQLLHPEIRRLDLTIKRNCEDQIKKLERELRILLTILGDSSLLLCDAEYQEFRKVLAEFETVTIEAASLVCSLVKLPRQGLVNPLTFPGDPVLAKLLEEFVVVLNQLDLLKTNIRKSLHFLSSISRSAYVTPNTSVVDSLVIVDSLIYDLEDLMNRENNQIADVKDQIKGLHKWLTVVQSSIRDTESPQPSEIGELKEPLMRIGDMAYAAEYLVISFSVGDAPLWYLIPRLIYINDEIELIGTQLIEITKKYKSGGLKVAEYFSTPLALQAKGNTEVNDVTVGFEEKATDISDLLVRGTERLQVISIFGMPGLGKTTLAKKLYNHPSVTYFFHKLSWCVVSQTYQRKAILTDILINLKTEFSKDSSLKMDEESLVEHIYKTLKGRRYLIVMDDIWDSNVWDDFLRYFPDDGNGSRILFTSRNKEVAPPNSIIYALPPLTNDQCWELLEKKLFDGKPCPPELQRVGKEIAVNCCGLPLAVVVIAGILSNLDRNRSTWEDVGGRLASYIFDGRDNSSVMQILELSYKHLPDHLKPCFLYFGAFGEDSEIPAWVIMKLWIAEGFVHKEEEKSADDVAEEYLRKLIDKSLVMVVKRRWDGGVKFCVIHDLLRDLCLRICKEENFLKHEISKLGSILRVYSTNPPSATIRSYCQHMRCFCGNWMNKNLYVRDMRLLRILASESRLNQLIGIEYLVNLRFLIVCGKSLESIGGLVNLEYLYVATATDFEMVYLPPAIVKMRKLRYIHVWDGTAKYDKNCDSSQPNNLEYLSCIILDELKDEEMLKYSPHLRKLKCKYELRPVEKSAYPHFDLRFLTQLQSLNLAFADYRRCGLPEEFGFPLNIRKLTLRKSRFHWEKMSIIGRLENLEVLKLEREAFVGERWDTRDGEFQKLRFLKLKHIEKLTEWNVESSQHFPRLRQLVLSSCEDLQEIPCEIGEIPTLQLIKVKGRCQTSLVESAQRIQKEQCEDFGNEELRLIIRAY